jgi:hypothetical protein
MRRQSWSTRMEFTSLFLAVTIVMVAAGWGRKRSR